MKNIVEQALEEVKALPETANIHSRWHTFKSLIENSVKESLIEEYSTLQTAEVDRDGSNNTSVRSLLREQIKHRYRLYFVYPGAEMFHEGDIIDSLLPSIICGYSELNTPRVKDTLTQMRGERVYTLSRYFAVKYGLRRVPILDQLKLLGYDPVEVKRWIRATAAKKLDLLLIGYGGLNLNVLENLKELLNVLNVRSLFSRITIYEDDAIEFHNLFRFSTEELLSASVTSIGHYLSNLQPSSNKLNLCTNLTLARLSRKRPVFKSYYFNPLGGALSGIDVSKTILFGAPDINTRQSIEEYDANVKKVNFICTTHQDNHLAMYKNPHSDTSMQVESYGTLELTPFFFNTLVATVELLKTLASDSLDDIPNDTCLYSKELLLDQLNFKPFVSEGYKIPNDFTPINPGEVNV